jgi:ribonuclease P protein component
MISKQFRLTERQVKKVLTKSKPFFSYGLVLNKTINRLDHNRYAIVLWAKSVNHNVTRNFFRRRYYEHIRTQLEQISGNYDVVCVVKKQTKLDRKDKASIMSFDKDIKFLFNKIT